MGIGLNQNQTQGHEHNFVRDLWEWTEETVRQNLVMFRCRMVIKELEREIDHLKEKVGQGTRGNYN